MARTILSPVAAATVAPGADGLPARPFAAAGFLVLGSALVAATTVLAKGLGTGAFGPALHPLQLAHGRFVFALLAVAAVLAFVRPHLTRPALPWHAARATCGFTGVVLLFAAATMIPLADATAISFLSPVITMILAALVLRERVGWSRWSAAGLSLVGALVLLRPGGDAIAFGALLALCAAMVLGVEMTIIKRLTRREGPLQILLMSNLFGTLFASLAVGPVFQMPTGPQWLALAGIGLLMFLAQVCYVQAMRRADASFVAPVAYTTLVFAALYDVLVFKAWPDAISLAGAGLILAGALVLTTREPR